MSVCVYICPAYINRGNTPGENEKADTEENQRSAKAYTRDENNDQEESREFRGSMTGAYGERDSETIRHLHTFQYICERRGGSSFPCVSFPFLSLRGSVF